MSSKNRWLLPAGIEEVLPENAAIIESTRRKCLDLFNVWGYQMVIPPLIEFLDSLLLGDCEDLDLQTFKVTDQISGRSMGIHADMTPQVARIEAHRLGAQAPSRLCYCDTVLHTLPESSLSCRETVDSISAANAGIRCMVLDSCSKNEFIDGIVQNDTGVLPVSSCISRKAAWV